MYTLYASMRDGRNIFMAEYDKPGIFLSILKNFEVSYNIDTFTIYENDKVYYEKKLGRKSSEGIYQKRKIR